ncbi:hypothetical protein [Mycobacteroides abscessus]|uniref:hypothetical protein n=1 Tax=Mycobacteroides abscessus TaxID=36809 RepID=UPI00092AC476|nr:hypothetical protein [Mycobacteroides abscessus]MDO3312586.1 hypothetical protein [Mycobacteroides abscessus subsp. abscessus]MDO3344732.1 hypothetical protein [Mycobacteroides abscessus subsp. abscessus]SHP02818.1 Uncharacterised protein [Mycobacteroides abscessus subsp. abscessus]SHP18146.1 Uncharacterised protein [Mycobacteroides abscessus subsp. abscessus]SHP89258.1 Uncharacterised protein [Mycobacteroides abscessus subsp. abscessus]
MSDWKLIPSVSGRIVHRRDLQDRIVAYVDYETDWEQEDPLTYHWSIEDGSCGRVLEQDWVDGKIGLAQAKKIADEAVDRRFPVNVK